MFPEMEEERDAAEEVKRGKPILVILGNIPYNAFAGVSPAEEERLVEPYKEGLNKPIKEGGWGIKKFNLDDLYIRFFRLAERRIVEGKPGMGIVCFISNFSYLGESSFVVMRKRFMEEFDLLWFDCMNGDSRETGKLTPDGKPDPSVFSTEYHPVGIRKGTCIGLLTRKGNQVKAPIIRYRDFWGVTKRLDLLESLRAEKFNTKYQRVTPTNVNRFSFRPSKVSSDYLSWPKLVDLCENAPLQGMDEDRANALIDFSQEKLISLMKRYFSKNVEWQDFAALGTGLSRQSAGFKPKHTREEAKNEEEFDSKNIKKYLFRPFDSRWCYYSGVPNVWKRCRPQLWEQSQLGNKFLLSQPSGVASPEGVPFLFTKTIFARDSMRGHAIAFPIQLYFTELKKEAYNMGLFDNLKKPQVPGKTVNLSVVVRDYLKNLGIKDLQTDSSTSELIWMHALAIGYTPAYLSENADGIRQDWPRIPLPKSREILERSAQLGREVAQLLDTEFQVKGVTSGAIRTELKAIGIISKIGGKSISPDKGELDLTAGWGHLGKDGVTMPGKGKIIERDYTPSELEVISKGVRDLGLSLNQALDHLGKATCAVYLNDVAFWKNIPIKIWKYTIGGYQVSKKWLSYRERDILGRGLTMDEVREVTDMVRRIATILLLEPTLDGNYRAVKESCCMWPSS